MINNIYKIFNVKLIILFLFIIYSVPVFALNLLEERDNISKKCNEYNDKNKNISIKEAYPVFAGTGVNGKIHGFKCLNYAKGQSDKYACVYSFKDTDLDGAYDKLSNILSNRGNSLGSAIILRKKMPASDAEDILNNSMSLENENAGYTCYLYKDKGELWIETNPNKYKKLVMILKEKDDNSTDIYYYENILHND